jgi:hypothetical protein
MVFAMLLMLLFRSTYMQLKAVAPSPPGSVVGNVVGMMGTENGRRDYYL